MSRKNALHRTHCDVSVHSYFWRNIQICNEKERSTFLKWFLKYHGYEFSSLWRQQNKLQTQNMLLIWWIRCQTFANLHILQTRATVLLFGVISVNLILFLLSALFLFSTYFWGKYLVLKLLIAPLCSAASCWLCLSVIWCWDGRPGLQLVY